MKNLLFLFVLTLFCSNSFAQGYLVKIDEDEVRKNNKIKVKKEYRYDVKFGEADESSKFLKYIYTFNEEGQLIKYETFAQTESEKKYAGFFEYTRDEQGRETKRVSYKLDGTMKYMAKFEYDKDTGTERQYDIDGKLTSKSVGKYLPNNKPVEILVYKPDGSIANKKTTEYNKEGLELSFVEYWNLGKSTNNELSKFQEIISKYEDNKCIQSLAYYDIFDETYNTTSELTYDENGNIIKKIVYDYKGEVKEIFNKKFDKDRLQIYSDSGKLSGEPTSITKYEYEKF